MTNAPTPPRGGPGRRQTTRQKERHLRQPDEELTPWQREQALREQTRLRNNQHAAEQVRAMHEQHAQEERRSPACSFCGQKQDPKYAGGVLGGFVGEHFDELPVHHTCKTRALKYFAPYRQVVERRWHKKGWKAMYLWDHLLCGHIEDALVEQTPRDRSCERCAPDVLREALAESGGRLWTRYPDAVRYEHKHRNTLPAIAQQAPIPG